jgi:hypothetical protein
MIPRTLLIAAGAFDGLSAERVGSAIGRGLSARGWSTDLCPIVPRGEVPGEVRALLETLELDARMRRSRAVILAEWRLRAPAPAYGATFEIATRARQAGVPAYAVTAENGLSSFCSRIFDLQAILEAASVRALEAAGRRLAGLV